MMNPAEFANIAKSENDLWWYRGMRRILFGMLDPLVAGRTFRRVLEAGCGTGYMSQMLGDRYRWPMFPADLSSEGLAHARRLHLERLAQCNVTALPFSNAAFDLALSFDVMVHLAPGDEESAMREFARVLAPGGLLIIRTAALELLRSRHSMFAHERQRFTRGRLAALARRHGIRVKRITYANSLLFPVALVKFRIWEPLLRKPAASGVAPVPRWLDQTLYAPLRLEAAWLGAGRTFPVGQSLILIGEKAV
ncbi:MAG: class I SAM-dependent methyltransferase [Bryobacteraceae bacterium]